MYRTEKLYEKLKDQPLKYPICVPTYGRPDNALIKWVQKPGWNIPKNKLLLFIRNTPEQRELYKPLQKYARIVLIPASTRDVGETRMYIINWAIKHQHKVIFMLDDRVNGIWWLTKTIRNGKLSLDVDKRSTPADTFKIWSYQHEKAGMVISGIADKGFHWMPDNINAPIVPLNSGCPSVCIALSPLKMRDYGINYRSSTDYGVEDLGIIYQLLEQGLPFGKCTDICYSQAAPSDHGGNTAVQPGMTRNERLDVLKKTFWERVLKLPWGTPHPGFKVVQRKNESNVIQLNRAYWRTVYGNSE